MPDTATEQDTPADAGFVSRFFYCSKASRSEREEGLLGRVPCCICGGLDTRTHVDPHSGRERKCLRNDHVTVKPVDLLRWLCRMVKMPRDTVILDPFMGSGTTGVAAVREGAAFVGVERMDRSFAIAFARVEHTLLTGRENGELAPERRKC